MLIDSQRERLSDWTSPFKGKVRFALYNGATPESKPEIERRRCPEEVIDRTILRSAPPPILVTNITMLEYMLVRFEDNPILQHSKGKLRYIILDEAHSYVGSRNYPFFFDEFFTPSASNRKTLDSSPPPRRSDAMAISR